MFLKIKFFSHSFSYVFYFFKSTSVEKISEWLGDVTEMNLQNRKNFNFPVSHMDVECV